MRIRTLSARLALVLVLLFLIQLSGWYLFARSQVLRSAFLHDDELTEDFVWADDFRPEIYGSTYKILIICDELAEELSRNDISRVANRMRTRGEALFEGHYARLVTYKEWMNDGIREQTQSSPEAWTRVSGICGEARLNTPILAQVDCDDRTFSLPAHGHTHYFLHLFGFWIPIWSGGYWVT